MDYKYIEQLLERFWQCEASLEEEQILRTFFQQKEVPAHLLPYKDLFAYEQTAKEVKLSDDFDAKILAQIEKPEVKARRVPLTIRMRPLYKAAAIVAITLSLGTAAQRSFNKEVENDYNYETYKDTYTDPQVAYGEISEALMTVSESINKYQEQQANDSVTATPVDADNDPVAPDSITIE